MQNNTLDSSSPLYNYPNPFSSSTKLSFSLKESGPVTLSILDNTGKQVAILLQQEEREVGQHELNFDGSFLPSGIYFYSLKTKEGITTRKMNIVR